MHNYRKSSLYSLLIFWLLLQAGWVLAENTEAGSMLTSTEAVDTATAQLQIEQILEQKLGFYATRYSDIDFILLDTAGKVDRNMAILHKILGEEPVPLDYEHPESVRHTLLMATLARIELLLHTDVGSATLFKPGKDALARRKRVCVITMNPFGIARDDRAATHYLLDLPEEEFATIPEGHYLDKLAHLRFALDHEVYHCLDTIMHGPVPISRLKYWGDYHMLREEDAADSFGLIMHMASQGSLDSYAQMLWYIRGLSLLSGDIDHYTYQALAIALQQDPARLADENFDARLQLADQISKQAVGSYDDFLRYAQAACAAVRELGSQCVDDYRDKPVDHALVQTLINDTRKSYREVTGHVLPAPH